MHRRSFPPNNLPFEEQFVPDCPVEFFVVRCTEKVHVTFSNYVGQAKHAIAQKRHERKCHLQVLPFPENWTCNPHLETL
jgi:hypothetical protein